jgi:hypothetical protein
MTYHSNTLSAAGAASLRSGPDPFLEKPIQHNQSYEPNGYLNAVDTSNTLMTQFNNNNSQPQSTRNIHNHINVAYLMAPGESEIRTPNNIRAHQLNQDSSRFLQN